jgi:hypothetical protein
MQGFNELVTPFYDVLLKCVDRLFNVLTKTGLDDFYTEQDQPSIVLGRIKQFAYVIRSLRLHPRFYCLRWFTLLFAQEHDLPTLLLIWDSLLAHFSGFLDYLYCMAIGHIHAVEGKLSKANYAQTLGALQNLEIVTEIKSMLVFANQCWEEDHRPQKPGWFAAITALTGFV